MTVLPANLTVLNILLIFHHSLGHAGMNLGMIDVPGPISTSCIGHP